MQNVFAHIISIGDEVLLGDTLDTNAHFIAKELNQINVQLREISVVHDEVEDIKNTIQRASKKAQIIITTGGLGPTRDDKTKYIIADLLQSNLSLNPKALSWVEEYYEKTLNRKLNELTRNQALLPRKSIPLRNNTGTACGIWSEYNGAIIINLPGVPLEMKHLMQTQVIPKIKSIFNCSFRIHKYLKIKGIPESNLAILLKDFEDNLPTHIKLAYLPKNSRITLRLTAWSENKTLLEKDLENITKSIKKSIPCENIYAEDQTDTLEKIKTLCLEKKLSIGTAESFTAGLLAKKLIAISGSSSYFKGGIVAYSPTTKNKILGVDETLIKEKGVVNEATALQMAQGLLEVLSCDIALSSTGVAGPNSDEFNNSVGLAYIGVASQKKSCCYSFYYPNYSREDFTEKIADIALEKLISFLIEEM